MSSSNHNRHQHSNPSLTSASSSSSDLSPDSLFRLNEAKDKSSLRSPLPRHLFLSSSSSSSPSTTSTTSTSTNTTTPITALLRPKPLAPSLGTILQSPRTLSPLTPSKASMLPPPLPHLSSRSTSSTSSWFPFPELSPSKTPITTFRRPSVDTRSHIQITSRNVSYIRSNNHHRSAESTSTSIESQKTTTIPVKLQTKEAVSSNSETIEALKGAEQGIGSERGVQVSTTRSGNETSRNQSPDIDQLVAEKSGTSESESEAFVLVEDSDARFSLRRSSRLSEGNKRSKRSRISSGVNCEEDIIVHLTEWTIGLCECPYFKFYGDNETTQWINVSGKITIPHPSSVGNSVTKLEDVGSVVASRPVVDRILPRRLRTSTGLLYELHGPMKTENGEWAHDFPSSFLKNFSDGFPDNWVRLIRDTIETLDLPPAGSSNENKSEEPHGSHVEAEKRVCENEPKANDEGISRAELEFHKTSFKTSKEPQSLHVEDEPDSTVEVDEGVCEREAHASDEENVLLLSRDEAEIFKNSFDRSKKPNESEMGAQHKGAVVNGEVSESINESELHETPLDMVSGSEDKTVDHLTDESVPEGKQSTNNEKNSPEGESECYKITLNVSKTPHKSNMETEPEGAIVNREDDETIPEVEPYANDEGNAPTNENLTDLPPCSPGSIANAVAGSPRLKSRDPFPDQEDNFQAMDADVFVAESDCAPENDVIGASETPHRSVIETAQPATMLSTPTNIAKRTRRAMNSLRSTSKTSSWGTDGNPKPVSPLDLRRKKPSASSKKGNQPERASENAKLELDSSSNRVADTQAKSDSTPKSITETPQRSATKAWRAEPLPAEFQTPIPIDETKGRLIPSPRSAAASSTAFRHRSTGQTPKSDGETTSKFTRSGRTVVKPGSWWTRFNCIRPVAETIKQEADGRSTTFTRSSTKRKSNDRAGSKTPVAGKGNVKTIKGTATPKRKGSKSRKGTNTPRESRGNVGAVPEANSARGEPSSPVTAAKSAKPLEAPAASEEASRSVSNVGKKPQRRKKKEQVTVEGRDSGQKTKAKRETSSGGTRRDSVPASLERWKPKPKSNGLPRPKKGSTDEKRAAGIAEHDVSTIVKGKRSKPSSAASVGNPKRRRIKTSVPPVEEPIIKDELLASDVEMADSHANADDGSTRKGRRTRRKAVVKQSEPAAGEKEQGHDSSVIDFRETMPAAAVVDPDARSSNPNSEQETIRITAGKGTLARTRQFRRALMQRNAGHEDDVFESTPYLRRQSLRRRIVEDKMLKTPASNLSRPPPIFTPSPSVAGLIAPDSTTGPPVFQSPDILKPFDAAAKEGYVHALKSRRLGAGSTTQRSIDERNSTSKDSRSSSVSAKNGRSGTASSSVKVDRDLRAALSGERGDLFHGMSYHDEESDEEEGEVICGWESEA